MRTHKNIRLQTWDYSSPAMYMITICIADRTHRLGTVTQLGELQLSSAGRMVQQEVAALTQHYPQVQIEEHIIMPNHVHMLVGLNLRLDEMSPISLTTVMRTLKSRTTNRYSQGVRMGLLTAFDQHLWQPGYYDTIMRNEAMTEKRRQYIVNNPANWRDDPYHELADPNPKHR